MRDRITDSAMPRPITPCRPIRQWNRGESGPIRENSRSKLQDVVRCSTAALHESFQKNPKELMGFGTTYRTVSCGPKWCTWERTPQHVPSRIVMEAIDSTG